MNQLHTLLLLQTSCEKFAKFAKEASLEAELAVPVTLFLEGNFDKILQLDQLQPILQKADILDREYQETQDINAAVAKFAVEAVAISEWNSFMLALALGQCFVQLNYTGPDIDGFTEFDYFFSKTHKSSDLDSFKNNIIQSLSLEGLFSYELSRSPLLLCICLHLLEKLTNTSNEASLLLNAKDLPPIEAMNEFIKSSVDTNESVFVAAAMYWRSRFLQVQNSLLPEVSGYLVSVSGTLLESHTFSVISKGLSDKVYQEFLVSYHLENAKNYLQATVETLTLESLQKAHKVSGLELCVTGARAKRTKYQEKAVASLVVLAKSATEFVITEGGNDDLNEVENKELNSDLFLETIRYESLEDDVFESFADKTNTVVISYDNEDDNEDESASGKTFEQKIIPIAIRSDAIPAGLKELDPNDQPKMNDLDCVQVLLRAKTLRQSTPAKNALVEEQLLAILSRLVANNKEGSPRTNWLIFTKTLWERSLIESQRAKTLERGIFQMQALVEDINAQIRMKLFPEAKLDSESKSESASAARLRFLHQLPLTPCWDLDSDLATRFISIGSLKSALEIYERLGKVHEMAMCQYQVGQKDEAISVINKRLEKFPNDARAVSLLGDFTKDATLWQKAWDLGRYAPAKVALARFVYAQKANDRSNVNAAMSHMKDALTVNPLDYNGWYFYGCISLEVESYSTAAEAFTRCVSIDDTNTHSWSNLGSALLNMGKSMEAFTAYGHAIKTSEGSNWRVWDNYLVAAAKVQKWGEVLRAANMLLKLNTDEKRVNLDLVQALVSQLLQSDYPKTESDKLSFFQKSCIEYVCVSLPKINTGSSVLWKLQARVELWRKKPWDSLAAMEKAFRVDLNNDALLSEEKVWNQAVESCVDLVASYESLGELPGKHGAGDVVCKDWKFRARTSIRTLMSKGRISWEDSAGWDKLLEAKEEL